MSDLRDDDRHDPSDSPFHADLGADLGADADGESEPCASVQDLVPGRMVNASLRLVAPLGEGGMGCVWIADHLALQTQVAVKFMTRALTYDSASVARFAREAASAARVKSPHVVQMFDYGVTRDGVPYIVMELLEGRDLAKVIADRGALPPALVLAVVAQAAKALSRAHARGVVHRDIKPENLFLCDAGEGAEGQENEPFVKILDFGIAKVSLDRPDNATRTGAMLGSPRYMSPEQLFGARDLDARSDLWSLGIVAYEALTGVPPFDGSSVAQIAMGVHGAPKRPSALVEGLPRAVDGWFARACARERSERFASATEMAQALAIALGVQGPRAAPPASTAEAFPLVAPGHTVATGGASRGASVASVASVAPARSEAWRRDDSGDHVSYSDLDLETAAGLPSRTARRGLWLAAGATIALATAASWMATRGAPHALRAIATSAPNASAPTTPALTASTLPPSLSPSAPPSAPTLQPATPTDGPTAPTAALTSLQTATAPRPPEVAPPTGQPRRPRRPSPVVAVPQGNAPSTPSADPALPEEYGAPSTPPTPAPSAAGDDPYQ